MNAPGAVPSPTPVRATRAVTSLDHLLAQEQAAVAELTEIRVRIGHALRDARTQRGLKLKQVGTLTGLRCRQVAAIEQPHAYAGERWIAERADVLAQLYARIATDRRPTGSYSQRYNSQPRTAL